ncbi:MAG: nuclear transport factor 2 family protein [Ferrovibrionaceae bacterium]
MTDLKTVAENYIAAWNEVDAAARRALVARTFTESCAYVDPLMQGQGHDGIEAMIAGVRARFPDFRFILDGAVDGYGDKIRFSWALGPAGIPDMIKGTDFGLVAEGRLQAVTGFLDKVPPGM